MSGLSGLTTFIAILAIGTAAFVKFDRFDKDLWKDQESVLEQVERMKNEEVKTSTAKPCDNTCKAPNCRCSSWDIPGGLAPKDVPQMIVLTFQNAVSEQNYLPYRRIFSRANPNNCSATGTFFVSHKYTDYYQVQSLWSQGHEIGDNTVTSASTYSWDEARWTDEIGGKFQFSTEDVLSSFKL